jgi:tetratricopeptide (TPR) repeat protein
MRRMECALLAALLVLGLCGCGQRPAAAASSAGGTWQEQYDLGMKYLEDGRYAEAVEAFTAAIQIDPKQAPAYLGLADAYVGQGDYENAKKALKDGLSATGDESLQTRLDELNSGESDKSPAASSAEAGGDKPKYEGTVAEDVQVTGHVANLAGKDTEAEYEKVRSQYAGQGVNVGLRSWGVYFDTPISATADGKTVSVAWADIQFADDALRRQFMGDDGSAGPNLGKTLRMTGTLVLQPDWQRWQWMNANDGTRAYVFFPLGPYQFWMESCESAG